MLRKMAPIKWKGDLYNPEDGKTYGGEISYDTPTKLTLTGCLMGIFVPKRNLDARSRAAKAPNALNQGS